MSNGLVHAKAGYEDVVAVDLGLALDPAGDAAYVAHDDDIFCFLDQGPTPSPRGLTKVSDEALIPSQLSISLRL